VYKGLAEFTEIGKDDGCKIGLSINLKGKQNGAKT
jgi:hypothetical protein